jgi:hypothetical protein
VPPDVAVGGTVSFAMPKRPHAVHPATLTKKLSNTSLLKCATFCRKCESAQVQFAVGFKIQGKTGPVVVDAEDALIAALKVKMQRPEALIAYVRQQNKRGDTRHPMRRLGSENA